MFPSEKTINQKLVCFLAFGCSWSWKNNGLGIPVLFGKTTGLDGWRKHFRCPGTSQMTPWDSDWAGGTEGRGMGEFG